MAEPRPDMLPAESQTQPEEKPAASVGEDEQTPPAAPVPETKPVKTPDNELLAALKEERGKRKELEQKLKDIESSSESSVDEEAMSDEGRVLKSQLTSLTEKLTQLEEERQLDKIISQYPAIADKLSEFDEFRAEYPRHKLENVAKLFLAEKGLLETLPARKGLEHATGGDKTAPSSSSIPAAEIDRLMKGNERKFIKMIREGKIDPDKIV